MRPDHGSSRWREMNGTRELPAGIALREELEALGYPRDVRLGFPARHWIALALYLTAWALVCAGQGWRGAGLPEPATIVFWAVGSACMLVSAIILRMRSRATLRSDGVELERRADRVIPWSSIRAARLRNRDLTLELVEGGRVQSVTAYVGWHRRPTRK